MLGQETKSQGTLVVSAIYGLGGIGKSTLAAAIAHDRDVKACFTDGVLWATLGKEPDLLPLLSSWILALGDNNYKPIQSDDAKRHLQTLLNDKKVLLVVDDAWNPEHVEYFQVGGAGCRVLVTTREAVILGASRYDLDVMTKSESLKLLESQPQPRQFTPAEKQQAELLAETVGYLPLALELAAAQIADGITWSELLEDLRAEIARLDTLDLFVDCSSEEKRKKYSLVASFNLSLNSLTPELLQQFAWFGVLPEDVAITHAMAATLWGVNSRQALTILRQLRSKALLQTGTIQFDEKPTYRLHDLMHDVAVGLLRGEKFPNEPGKLPGLGFSLPAAHSALLDRYQEKTQSGQWHTLPADGYIHAHLTWHFQQANQLLQIHQLLQEETPAGANGWYEACASLGQTTNFVTDVARAWELTNAAWNESDTENRIKILGLQCRYALMQASVKSITESIPATLLVALVQKKVWSDTKGLDYAQQNPETLATLVRSLESLPQGYGEKIREIVKTTADKFHKALLLCALAHHQENLQQEALIAIRSIGNVYYTYIAWGTLPSKLPDEIKKEAWEWVKQNSPNNKTDFQFHTLRKYSNKADFQFHTLRKLGTKWEEFLPRTLKETSAIETEDKEKEEHWKSKSIYQVLILLSKDKEKNKHLLIEFKDKAKEIKKVHYPIYVLVALASDLPDTELPQILEEVRTNADEKYRARALAWIAYYLNNNPLAPEYLLPIRNSLLNNNLLKALSILAPELLAPDKFRNDLQNYLLEVLQNCQAVELYEMLDMVLAKLIPLLLKHLKIENIYKNILKIEIKEHQYPIFDVLFREASKEQLEKILDARKRIKYQDDQNDQDDQDVQTLTLCKFLQHDFKKPPNLIQNIFEATKSIKCENDKAEALVILSPYLAQVGLIQEAWDEAETIPKENWLQIWVKSSLFPYLREEQKQNVINEIKNSNLDNNDNNFICHDLIRIELLYTSIFPREKRLEEVKKIKLEFCYPLAIKRLLP
ncbi:NB-ARC domain-containing protein, partial [Nostoc linckia]